MNKTLAESSPEKKLMHEIFVVSILKSNISVQTLAILKIFPGPCKSLLILYLLFKKGILIRSTSDPLPNFTASSTFSVNGELRITVFVLDYFSSG